MALKVIETVFKLRDNVNKVLFEDKITGDPVDFTGASRMVLSFLGSAIVADTDVDADLIDFTQSEGTGLLIFNLGALLVTETGELAATLVVYDPTHLLGQVIVCKEDTQLLFEFVTC